MESPVDGGSLAMPGTSGGGSVTSDNDSHTLSSQRRPRSQLKSDEDSDSEFSEGSSGLDLPDLNDSDYSSVSLEVCISSSCSSLSCFGDLIDAPGCDDELCTSRSDDMKKTVKKTCSNSLEKTKLRTSKKRNLKSSKKRYTKSSPGPRIASSIKSSLASRCRCHFDEKLLSTLLKQLMGLKVAVPFVKLVPRSQAPDYYCVIKRPMDLSTVQTRLDSHQYKTNKEILRDIMLMFTNFDVYNAVDDELQRMGKKMQSFFYYRCNKLNLLQYSSF